MKLTILGSGHGTPALGHASTSMLLETQGKYYLVDAADGTQLALLRCGVKPGHLSAVMITHSHTDHIGGLPVLLSLYMKYYKKLPDLHPRFMLPDMRAAKTFREFIELADYHYTEILDFGDVKDGFDDGTLKMTSYRTRHLLPNSENSFSLKVTAENKTIFFSGDLDSKFSDFHADAANGCDLAVVELTHYPLENAIPVFKQLKLGRLLFNHIGSHWQTPEGEAEAREACRVLPYPVDIAYDGFTLEL